ncbi:MAG: elongation factor Ts [SAR86 cluster bacterium BACL1 MAG-121105-bin34]|jgi:elongation factor Ts|uniref:Elongation factor Ts n=2 Tax=SAR86 cluster TaxID=62672 RepID=A0A0R2UEW7_9GAMM|nr:MAG: elongation factor Ts [SAR86 cluster bacterium BACL1 MAG-120507-bin14]KRO95994.1 MAG: elongation factor Ts [SAR86 cluster bacterium BACL1 MAG-120820-bin45]KRO97545.1 MAG: elongation factor Ts [SAR86 cluster bacterium BACL1 MAG-120828-bin5]KRO99313.1 MAG: elongation factor Ts [SAR86 cluster bacterium BACL1 MAG-120823-bin87]KRP00167.1 MAG: elongation factor Ts [SAR86 cluster bacterium BACL1 MAG-120813-bin36]KRP02840.1 MAG: elongation factor Ts [SAR86 cluster bacterium BACL1 MAG-120924-bin
MSISASQVKELREMSGVGMMECKKALVETNGDLDKALDLLRANSSLKADKKASRVAADGEIKVAETASYVSLIEINSETDFAAKDAQFKDFTNSVASYLADSQVDSIEELNTQFNEKRQTLIQSIGENIQLRRLKTLQVPGNGSIGSYIHSDGRLAALVAIDTDNQELAKDLAMHVSATNPSCLNSTDLDPEVLDRERAIFLVQAQESGKDAAIMDKMVEGKIKRFLSEVTLVSQTFVKNPDLSIQQLLDENNASIVDFVRFKVGEGIEVEVKDFAAEVAEQLKQ